MIYVALHLLNDSRTGRAWRSLREDPLAAELMGMPVNRLKLMAFAFGASVAAVTGTFAAALNGSVFPQNFEFPLLITVYTMVILGGAGSQAGVVLGAVIVGVLLEALRDPGDARGLFYVVIVLALVAAFRTSLKLAVVLGGTILFGVVARLVAGGIDDAWTTGPGGGERPARVVGGRVGDRAGAARQLGRAGLVHRPRRAGARADPRARLGCGSRSWSRRSTSPPSSGRT